MKPLLWIALLLISLPLAAKKAPKWKTGGFKTTASGIQYKIVKAGKADSIGEKDVITIDIFNYTIEGTTYRTDRTAHQTTNIRMDDDAIPTGIKEAVKLLGQSGKGYFMIPPSLALSNDSLLCFMRVKKITHVRNAIFGRPENPRTDTVKADSIHFKVPDPNKKYFGDTLIGLMKLKEVPQLLRCSDSKVLIAFKFETTYFENGVQHKTILVFIECPETYGKDYFVAGKNYMLTCIPLLDDLKNGRRTMNAYSLEKLDRYYGLRVSRMGQ